MTQAVTNYAKVLFEAETPIEEIKEALEICKEHAQVVKVLSSPAVPYEQKERLIEKLFPAKAKALVATLCKNGSIKLLEPIVKAYQSLIYKKKEVLEATLYYVTKPSDERMEELKKNLCEKYKMKDVSFTLVHDAKLVGGFIVRIGDLEYDYSISRQISHMRQALNRTEVK
ncbi:MAG: ATP synthase F1 subunit delta [Eubacterium sp.]|nr:ATP synthase F1 subunit delta [Eubacterium sp.]